MDGLHNNPLFRANSWSFLSLLIPNSCPTSSPNTSSHRFLSVSLLRSVLSSLPHAQSHIFIGGFQFPLNDYQRHDHRAETLFFLFFLFLYWPSQVALVVKDPSANLGVVRDVGSIPGQGRSPGEGNDNPLQYFFLENPMYRAARRAMVHRVAQSRT